MARRQHVTPEYLEGLMQKVVSRRHIAPRSTPSIYDPSSFMVWAEFLTHSRDLADAVPGLIEHIRKLEQQIKDQKVTDTVVVERLKALRQAVDDLHRPVIPGEEPERFDDDDDEELGEELLPLQG